ncbi:MAG TPA: hypothetical protein VK902_16645 [Rubrobacter sp.]|jgi:hypothetical protein|nr:hypothetical protein [Rubrobacter sp.]
MMRATLLAATVAMAILMMGCGEEGAGQGSSPENEAEPGPSQAKQAQPKKPETMKGEVTKKPSQEQQQQKPEPASRNIPGLTPQDVYLNLENRGFKCSEPKLMGPDNEVRWTCEKQEANGEYLVEINSSDANSVRLVEAWVISDDPARADALAQDFLGYVATVSYEGAQPDEAKAWVEQNVGSKASAEFDGVSYTLGGKAGRRFLKLEKLEG